MLDSTDLEPERKEEVIRSLWTIIMMAIDLGLSVQTASTSSAE
jgi:hypothetical protein